MNIKTTALRSIVLSLAAFVLLTGVAGCEDAQSSQTSPAEMKDFASFIEPQELAAMAEADAGLVIIDARKPEAYALGHIPTAINLPPHAWRTPSAKPGQGDSQYVYRTEAGEPDIAHYEQMLGDAGVSRDATVVVYGNHAGKADGSVPAMILDWLGQERVHFLDGAGFERWQAAGLSVTTAPETLAPTTYAAQPDANFVWNLDEVLANLGNESVVFFDTRSQGEYDGTNKRSNARGGHIPGAMLCDYDRFLNKDEHRTSVSVEEARRLLAERNITPDKTVVLYCQTATRVSLPYLMLKDLGYENVYIYDASWHEYGNRSDTPIETDGGVTHSPATEQAPSAG